MTARLTSNIVKRLVGTGRFRWGFAVFISVIADVLGRRFERAEIVLQVTGVYCPWGTHFSEVVTVAQKIDIAVARVRALDDSGES